MIDIEKNCAILEAVASNYPESSDEHQAIKLAAQALIFAWEEQGRDEFRDFLANIDRDLTPDEVRHLRNMGVADV